MNLHIMQYNANIKNILSTYIPQWKTGKDNFNIFRLQGKTQS